MPTYDGITINICVDGKNLPEFMIEEDKSTKRISCWVPSQQGKEFAVLAENLRARNKWGPQVKVDGMLASSWLFNQDRRESANIGFFRQSGTVLRPLRFSKLELVDDDSLLGSSLARTVGQIEVRCRYVEVGGPISLAGNTGLEGNKKMHEKSKKGLTEHIGVGKELPASSHGFTSAELEHIVTFVFQYRPLEYLQAQDIAPREALPEHLPPVVDAPQGRNASNHIFEGEDIGEQVEQVDVKAKPGASKDEDDDEIKALLTIVDEMRARRRKRTSDCGLAGINKKAKKEERPAFIPGEVIDLT